jgi:hypothetical protein
MNERIKELANIAAGRNIKTSPAVSNISGRHHYLR